MGGCTWWSAGCWTSTAVEKFLPLRLPRYGGPLPGCTRPAILAPIQRPESVLFTISSSSSINASCPALIFFLAVARSKNSARSISGNSFCRPECGGHSIVNVLLLRVAGIAVALERPGVDDLAALLLDGLQRNERASGLQAGFFLELPLGREQQIFVGFWLALGDRPCPFILVDESRGRRDGPAGLGWHHP